MEAIKLLHLSDLHISDLTFFNKFDAIRKNADGDFNYHRNHKVLGQRYILERIAQWSSENKDEFDAILITGDLVDQARLCDLKLAQSFIQNEPGNDDFLTSKISTVPSKYPTISGIGKRILLLPGNHDRLKSILYPAPCLDRFNDFFSNHWNEKHGQGIIPFFFPSSATPSLCVICCDFSLKQFKNSPLNPSGLWGRGIIDPERLKLLEKLTSYVKRSSIPVLWALHFAPLFSDQNSSEKLVHSDKLIDLANQLDVDHIFCGHTHQKRLYSPKKSKVKIYCTGTSACLKVNEWNTVLCIHEVQLENKKIKEVNHVEYVWDEDGQTFY